jgi:hypothetical protein
MSLNQVRTVVHRPVSLAACTMYAAHGVEASLTVLISSNDRATLPAYSNQVLLIVQLRPSQAVDMMQKRMDVSNSKQTTNSSCPLVTRCSSHRPLYCPSTTSSTATFRILRSTLTFSLRMSSASKDTCGHGIRD